MSTPPGRNADDDAWRPGAFDVDDDTAAPPDVLLPQAFDVPPPGDVPATVETFVEGSEPPGLVVSRRPRRKIVGRIAWAAAGLLVSLGVGLAADRLINDLFATHPWLGWLGVGALGVFVAALLVLAVREFRAVRRLASLEGLRHRAAAVVVSDSREAGQAILAELTAIYGHRTELADARAMLGRGRDELHDGSDMVRLAEKQVIAPLDARAKLVIGAAARRVAIVTAVSPRAIVDIAFVAYQSVRLAGDVARLYGARPGLFGSMRLMGEVLAHLAVTGGISIGDGIIEQIAGHGLAERASSRLGEGLLNGLMTVRVGIAAMRAVRPLPFLTQRPPMVMDYLGELASLTKGAPKGP